MEICNLNFLIAVCTRGLSAPFGLNGGTPGKPGHNWLERHSGKTEELQSQDSVEVKKGDVLCVDTPGGGGFGRSTFWWWPQASLRRTIGPDPRWRRD